MTATILHMPPETALRCPCGGAVFYALSGGDIGCVRCGRTGEHGPRGHWRCWLEGDVIPVQLVSALTAGGFAISNRPGVGLVIHPLPTQEEGKP